MLASKFKKANTFSRITIIFIPQNGNIITDLYKNNHLSKIEMQNVGRTNIFSIYYQISSLVAPERIK